jgi:phage FluMu protein gp41
MAELDVALTHGWKIAGRVYHKVLLRELTCQDFFSALEHSEVPVERTKPSGQMEIIKVSSPARFTRMLVLQQIASLDGEEIPLTPEMLRGLNFDDFKILAGEVSKLDQATFYAQWATSRGRG